MLRIAILDDERDQRENTHNLLSEYLNEHHIVAKVIDFPSARQVLNEVEDNAPFDIYIVDIVMPEMSGIEFGKLLRKLDRNGLIIYLTTSPDFALESYETHAFNYILKPVSAGKFAGILDEAIQSLNKRLDSSIEVKTHSSIIRIPLDTILYAELSNRAVQYHLEDGSSVFSTTLTGAFRDAVSPLLDDNRFVLCGASFLLNLHFVKMVDKDGALLTDNTRISLPKTACPPLRAAWSNYWLEGGTK